MGRCRQASLEQFVNLRMMSNIVFVCAALFVASVSAADWSATPNAICVAHIVGGKFGSKAMYTKGFGSIECVKDKASANYFKGACNNEGTGDYTITPYTDSTCTTKNTTAVAEIIKMGTSYKNAANSIDFAAYTCENCPPASEDVRETLIGGFFGIILAYSLFVCAGMYCCYGAGYRCDCTKEDDKTGQKTEWWGFGKNVGGVKH